jgi:hypothetical protein
MDKQAQEHSKELILVLRKAYHQWANPTGEDDMFTSTNIIRAGIFDFAASIFAEMQPNEKGIQTLTADFESRLRAMIKRYTRYKQHHLDPEEDGEGNEE